MEFKTNSFKQDATNSELEVKGECGKGEDFERGGSGFQLKDGASVGMYSITIKSSHLGHLDRLDR